MIRSVYYNQTDILRSIMALNRIDQFEADISYGNGVFYKNIQEPIFKCDISPQVDGVIECSSSNLYWCETGQLTSIVFDPPFLTYIKAAREHNSIMAKRFGGYWRYDELEKHYKETITEVYRALKKKGLFIFKCQDIIHNHKMHCTHVNVINWCDGLFRLKDLFILPAKQRMGIPEKTGEKKRIQKHARVFHSYFLVLERL